jgi:hypothetical protein
MPAQDGRISRDGAISDRNAARLVFQSASVLIAELERRFVYALPPVTDDRQSCLATCVV